MKTIWKFEVEITDEPRVQIPSGAQILHVEPASAGSLNIWALVDTSQPTEWRRLRIVGTGHPIPDADELDHVGTVSAAPFVWHLFSEKETR